MRSLISAAILLFSLAAAAGPHVGDGGSVGNGGDPIGIEFLQNANKVVEDVYLDMARYPEQYPELKSVDLRAVIKDLKVLVTEDDLWVEVDGRRQLSTAVNYRATMTIVINRKLWNNSYSRDGKLSLTFHEILGLVGLEKSGDYSISGRYKNRNFENAELIISRTPFPVIPAQAASCLSRHTAGPNAPPVMDIGTSHFRIPQINIFRSSSSKELVISLVRVTFTLPVVSGDRLQTYSCTYGGDQLAALSSQWLKSAPITGESSIPAKHGGPDMFSTDCPLYCGDIDTAVTKAFKATGDVDVYGLERDKDGNETPIKMTRTIQVEGYEAPK